MHFCYTHTYDKYIYIYCRDSWLRTLSFGDIIPMHPLYVYCTCAHIRDADSALARLAVVAVGQSSSFFPPALLISSSSGCLRLRLCTSLSYKLVLSKTYETFFFFLFSFFFFLLLYRSAECATSAYGYEDARKKFHTQTERHFWRSSFSLCRRESCKFEVAYYARLPYKCYYIAVLHFYSREHLAFEN